MDKVFIEHFYHMTAMDENLNWVELTHLLSLFSLNLRAFLYIYIKVLNSLSSINVTLEKSNASPLCILCMLMDKIIPHLTLTLVHTLYEESNPWEYPP